MARASLERRIPPRSAGQHLGYAVEGNLRGVLRKLTTHRPALSVHRELPFEFHVRPDAVLMEGSQVRALFIVAYNTVAPNSNMKFYRTRSEYRAIVQAAREWPQLFHDRFFCAVVLYGTSTGWKADILSDLRSECAPLVFLPEVLGDRNCDEHVTSVFATYRDRFEAGHSDAPEHVELETLNRGFLLDSRINDVLDGLLKQKNRSKQPSGDERRRSTTVRVPEPFSSRFRQGLGLASLFTDAQLDLLASGRVRSSPTAEELEALRKLRILDLGNVTLVNSIVGARGAAISLRARLEERAGQTEQVAYRPDFSDWTVLTPAARTKILAAHRSVPTRHPKVFRSGANEQAASNVNALLTVWSEGAPTIASCLRAPTVARLREAGRQISERSISPASWHLCSSIGAAHPLWELTATALRLSVQLEREQDEVDIDLPARRPERILIDDVAEKLRNSIRSSEPNLAAELVEEVAEFARELRAGQLATIAALPQPRLLSLPLRESWSNSLYRAITTNKTHNPLLSTMLDWLQDRGFSGYTFIGWPAVRSVALNRLPGVEDATRIQWQVIGHHGRDCLLAEARTITANNWGNKSKELYDRIAASRQVLERNGWRVKTLCVLDGDLEERAAEELRSGIGFDETYSFAEVIRDRFGDASAGGNGEDGESSHG